MQSFKMGQVDVLVATMNLGGRGVTIDGVSDLVLWDPANYYGRVQVLLG